MNFKALILLILMTIFLTACSNVQRWLIRAGTPPEHIAAIGDPVRGETLFQVGVNPAPPCSACHQVGEGGYGFSLGPKLQGISERAGERIEGYSPEAYLEDSILHPLHYVVSGYHVSMYPDYAQQLSQQDVADLVAYLMTL